jgi:nucleotide-binding universal stress UspA family protein
MAILVGFDDSDASARALERAAAQARERQQPLVVLAVLEMPLDPGDAHQFGLAGDGTPLMGPFPEPPEITEILADARARLEGTGVTADYVWAPGEPARLIVDVAKDRGVSTIIVGHHHHSMLGRLFGTDVASDVSRTADCEVVVVD